MSQLSKNINVFHVDLGFLEFFQFTHRTIFVLSIASCQHPVLL